MIPTFLVIGPNVWGKGNTPDAARKNAAAEYGRGRRLKDYIVYKVHPDTRVDPDGSTVYPSMDDAPVELYRVLDGKQVPAGTERDKETRKRA